MVYRKLTIVENEYNEFGEKTIKVIDTVKCVVLEVNKTKKADRLTNYKQHDLKVNVYPQHVKDYDLIIRNDVFFKYGTKYYSSIVVSSIHDQRGKLHHYELDLEETDALTSEG